MIDRKYLPVNDKIFDWNKKSEAYYRIETIDNNGKTILKIIV